MLNGKLRRKIEQVYLSQVKGKEDLKLKQNKLFETSVTITIIEPPRITYLSITPLALL
jgi:hypothetical protein